MHKQGVSTAASLAVAPEPRVAPRRKVFLPAQISGSAGVHRIHLLNLSPAGALVHGDVIPAAGSLVQLSCADSTWCARVVWCRDKRFGVVHVPALTATVVETLLAPSS